MKLPEFSNFTKKKLLNDVSNFLRIVSRKENTIFRKWKPNLQHGHWKVITCMSWELPLSVIPLSRLLPCHLGPPKPMLSIKLYVTDWLTAQLEHSTCPYQRSLLSFRMRSRSSVPSCASSSLDLMVIISCSMTLQICLAWSRAFCTQELYTLSCNLKERWLEERPGSSTLNFFQAALTHIVVESSQPLASENISPSSKRKYQLVRSHLPSVVYRPKGVQCPGTLYTCNLETEKRGLLTYSTKLIYMWGWGFKVQ